MQCILTTCLAPSLAHATDEIEYRLEWRVSKSGEVTKICDIKYSGANNLALLQKLPKSFPQSLIPVQEVSDELVESTEPTQGHYHWKFRGAKRDVKEVPSSLFAWLPSYFDPIAKGWEPSDQSRYYYDFRPLKITTRLIVRAPWKIEPADIGNEGTSVARDFVQVKYEVTKLTADSTILDNGGDLPGLELKNTIETFNKKKVDQKNIRDLSKDYEKWHELRTRPVFLNREQETSFLQLGYPRNRFVFDIGVGGGSSAAQSDNYGGLAVGLGLEFKREFRRNLAWRVLRAEIFQTSFGDPKDPGRLTTANTFEATEWSFGTLGQYSLTTPTKTGFLYANISLGPEFHIASLKDYTNPKEVSQSGLAWTADFQLGRASARPVLLGMSALGLRLKYSHFISGTSIRSTWILAMEVF